MSTVVEQKFTEMGARFKITHNGLWDERPQFEVDIKQDKKGQIFEVNMDPQMPANLQVLDTRPSDRHLVLMAKEGNRTFRFLCGHDEREWFVAAIPAAATTVAQAKQALKPAPLVRVETGRVKSADVHKRHKKLTTGGKIHRQGEFFFIPRPNFSPGKGLAGVVHRNEPLVRAAANGRFQGKPHMAEFLYRRGGRSVTTLRGQIVDPHRAFMLSPRDRKLTTTRTEDMQAYVKGRVRHPDHATLDLGDTWHEVITPRVRHRVRGQFVSLTRKAGGVSRGSLVRNGPGRS